MPNRMQQKMYTFIYNTLVTLHGERCFLCQQEPGISKNPLQIDHFDNDINNHDITNVHIICRKHNIQMRDMSIYQKKKMFMGYGATNEREREKTQGPGRTHQVRREVDYNAGSPEMQVNLACEPRFRTWLLKMITEISYMPKDEVIYGGAEEVGCSPSTTDKYLRKLTSSRGNLMIDIIDGIKCVVFKPGYGEDIPPPTMYDKRKKK